MILSLQTLFSLTELFEGLDKWSTECRLLCYIYSYSIWRCTEPTPDQFYCWAHKEQIWLYWLSIKLISRWEKWVIALQLSSSLLTLRLMFSGTYSLRSRFIRWEEINFLLSVHPLTTAHSCTLTYPDMTWKYLKEREMCPLIWNYQEVIETKQRAARKDLLDQYL